MFTGLVEAMGSVVELGAAGAGRRLQIEAPFALDLAIGESVSINGCCLTVIRRDDRCADFEAGPETLAKTNLIHLKKGSRVNLERALGANGRLGGHIVQGHVDGTAILARRTREKEWETFWFETAQLAPQLVSKGSVAVEGVSLTVVDVTSNSFSVALIPHTLSMTTLGSLREGAVVNIEVDILGKYVMSYLQRLRGEGGLTFGQLQSAGMAP